MALNRGEWSEIYTFLKLLGEGRLYAADADLNRIEDIYYPIIKVLRDEDEGNFEYCIDTEIRVCDDNENVLLSLPIEDFRRESLNVLNRIREGVGSFDIPDTVNFLESINVRKLKASSRNTRDITLIVHDINTGLEPVLGFSIKSYLGGDPTIVNSSGSTNFIYAIRGNLLNQDDIEEINNISTKSKIRDRLNAIEERGCYLEYSDMQSSTFKSNLIMIDSLFPKILAEMIKLYYKGEGSGIIDLTENLNRSNPCEYDSVANYPFYKYKIKNYLTDSALGMKPASAWNGFYDATGGYIVIKEDGDIVCYHIYNRNEFQDYLFNNTKLDTPSSGKFKFGKIYEEDGHLYFKLNLQVRFI